MLLAFILVAPWLGRARVPAAVAGAASPVGGLLVPALGFAIAAVAFSSRSSFRSLRPLTLPLASIVAVAVVGVMQLIPLPASVLTQIAPVNLQIYHETADLLSLYGRVPPPARISIAPEQTLGTVLRLGGYAVFLAAAVQLLRTRPRRRIFAGMVLAAGCLQVSVAGVLTVTRGEPFRGAFASPSDFGQYLLVLLPVAFGAFWAEVLINSDRGRGTSDRGERLAQRLAPLAARALAGAILGIGIVLAGSLVGFAAAAIAITLLLVAGSRRSTSSRRAAVAAALCIAASPLLASFASAQAPISSTSVRATAERSTEVWQTSVEAWKRFPIVGAGLGAFPDAFRRFQPRDLTGLVDSASSNLLQILVTGGAAGAFFAFLASVSLFFVLFRRWRAQRHREESALALSGLGVLLVVGLAGLAEFNLGVPSIAASLACVLGLAFAAADGSSREPARPPQTP